MVFYCERSVGFGNAVGLQRDRYVRALVHICEQALKIVDSLPDTARLNFFGALK